MNVKRNWRKKARNKADLARKRASKKPLIPVATDGLGIYQMVADPLQSHEKISLLPRNDSGEYIHCDELIDDEKQPLCLRRFLRYKRCPAIFQFGAHRLGVKEPQLFADYGRRRVKVVMASRFGDVGITGDLFADHGYDIRVAVEELRNFSEMK